MIRLAAIVALLVLAACGQPSGPATPSSTEPPASPEGPRDSVTSIAEFVGPWQVQNQDATKTCSVDLTDAETIGGYVIEIADGCAATFPVTGEIAAWRPGEDFAIIFADAARKERVRFYTPDERYVAAEEIDGIFTIVPLE